MQYTESIQAIKQACKFISDGQIDEAAQHIDDHYPFKPLEKLIRKPTLLQMTNIFIRDGFIDRYKGHPLVFPPSLRLISHYLPKAFPYHPNGKMSVGHIAYWQLFPTIDHIYPVARGGKDEESNWISCSMLTNSIKSNWTLAELGWGEPLPPGDMTHWDGTAGWFIDQIKSNKSLLSINYLKNWYNAAKNLK